jgi:hypothetical protein
MEPFGRSLRAAFTVFLVTAVLGGCAAPQTRAIIASPQDLPSAAKVGSVPFFPQARFHCGPATLAMALAWSGLDVTSEQMVPEVYTPGREGTLPPDMVSALRRHGRLAVPVGQLSEILTEISAGHPVIVFQNLGLTALPYWHFALAIGYDLDAGTISLHSGREAERTIGLSTFERTWTRAGTWALAVVPPGGLPATGTAANVARAAAGLERTGKAKAARETYRAMVMRWPDDLAAWIGRGNTSYALGDLAAAENAFRLASALHPDNAAAWNNLAHVLGKRGRTAEAITAAERAVELAGSDDAPYRDTLNKLKRSQTGANNS